MNNYFFSEWAWLLWFGFLIVLFSSTGNWGYTYQVHRKFRDTSSFKDAKAILNERYAKGEIKRDEFLTMRDDISSLANPKLEARKENEKNRPSGLPSPALS